MRSYYKIDIVLNWRRPETSNWDHSLHRERFIDGKHWLSIFLIFPQASINTQLLPKPLRFSNPVALVIFFFFRVIIITLKI